AGEHADAGLLHVGAPARGRDREGRRGDAGGDPQGVPGGERDRARRGQGDRHAQPPHDAHRLARAGQRQGGGRRGGEVRAARAGPVPEERRAGEQDPVLPTARDLMIVQVIAQGLSVGAVLALSALGLTIIYGVMGVVNLAHGEFVMLGAYSMVLLSGPLGAWVAIALTPLVVAVIGLCCDRTLIRFLYHDPVKSMLGTFGLAIVLRQLVLIIEGPQLRYVGLPVDGAVSLGFGQQFAIWRVFLIGFAIVVSVVVGLWLNRSATGLKVRTTTVDPDIAASLGMNVSRVNALAFATGTGLAGLAGALIAPLNSVFPNMG